MYTIPIRLCRDQPRFNRARQDIFGADKVESGFRDCPNKTGGLSRQWAVDNP